MNNENKGRSTCFVCGKVRNRQFMHRLFNTWVCNAPVSSYDNKMIYLKRKDGFGIAFHQCSLNIIKLRAKEIERLKQELNSNCVKLFGSLENFTQEQMLDLN